MDQTFDKMYFDQGDLIGGIDESGVSDIAGPLIASCVILPKVNLQKDDLRIFEVNDSKKIPEKYRRQHAEVIWEVATAIGIGEVTPEEVDYLGKHISITLAMKRAITACRRTGSRKTATPDFLIVDGTLPVNTQIPQKPIKQADTKSLCVAAASIVAKVYRDEAMIALHRQYPFYDWISNKGYPCENHFRGLDKHGVRLGVHRIKSWPFVSHPKYPENKNKWRSRRQRWRRITEARLENEL